LTIGISKPIYKIRITKSVKEDLIIWRDFLSNFNGKSLFLSDRWLTSQSFNLFTDASGTLGYGGVFGNHCFFGEWNTQWKNLNITLLELYPIVLAVEIWGSQFKNSCVVFHTDNLALVAIINKQTSKHVQIMFLIRKLVLSCLRYNVHFQARHIAGTKNILADKLSRLQVQQFHQLAPSADQLPVPVPVLPVLPHYKPH